MRNPDYFRNKRVTVVGLARSGLACANLLFRAGAQVSITDKNDTEATRRNAGFLASPAIMVERGGHTEDFIRGRDAVVVSPGVPEDAPPLVWARQAGIPLISEIECAWLLCPATVIAVTGSNGKTTVTTLIGRMLEAAGKKVFVCGNIGNPFSGEVEKMSESDYVSLEVSSFQLEHIETFKPTVAVFLNFSRNHLDRHLDMDDYLRAKKRLFMNQTAEDFLVLNDTDPVVKGLAAEASARVVYFRKTVEYNPNEAAVAAVGGALGIGEGLIRKVFGEFKGVEHRLEFVAEIKDVRFINDSKATTVESARWALNTIPSSVILIAGGKDKGNDYSLLRDIVRQKVKKIVAIGESRNKIVDSFRQTVPVQEALTMEEAVRAAFASAGAGECVLLSPMCASFDMFQNYEERGRIFKQIVGSLAALQK